MSEAGLNLIIIHNETSESRVGPSNQVCFAEGQVQGVAELSRIAELVEGCKASRDGGYFDKFHGLGLNEEEDVGLFAGDNDELFEELLLRAKTSVFIEISLKVERAFLIAQVCVY